MARMVTWTNGPFALAGLMALLWAASAPGQEGQPAPARTVTIPATRDALVGAARAALERGDWDTAENLAVQAERIPRGLLAIIKSRWSDTPAKVRRDVQAARTRAEQAPIETI